MKRLRYKIILVLVMFSIGVLMLNMAVVSIFFKQSFTRYVTQQHQAKMNNIAQELSDLYDDRDAWQHLLLERRHWHQWLRGSAAYARGDASGAAPLQSKKTIEHRGPPRKVFLYDSQKQVIYGPRQARRRHQLTYIPITHKQQTVAYIAFVNRHQLLSRLDDVFLKRQLYLSLLSLLFAVALSVLIATLLARRFLKPVEHVRHGLRAMVEGDYSQRVAVSGNDELTGLIQDVNHLAATLENQEQIQQRWMADISHELRTPLSVLKAQLEALEDGVRPFDQQQLQLLLKESQLLQKLVSDMRELSLSEPGSLAYQWQSLNVHTFLRDSEYTWANYLQESGFDFILHDSLSSACVLRADEQRLHQLFHNLMQNTCSYSDSPGKVRLSASIEHERLVLVWEDSTPSVDEALLSQLFERLYRVDDSRNRETGGSGLGLAICKNIVAAHDGTIEASISPLGGLAIVINMPCNRV